MYGTWPHFTRSVREKLEPDLAGDGKLSGWAQRHAASHYMSAHLDPGRADEAHTLAARLGWTRLGAGLQPVR